MGDVFYQEYRIEIRPFPIPGGWSAQMHIWSFHGGTTHMSSLSLPTPLAFSQEESVRAYAEKVARRWVDELRAESELSALTESPAAHAAEEQRDGTTGYSLLTPTKLRSTGRRRK